MSHIEVNGQQAAFNRRKSTKISLGIFQTFHNYLFIKYILYIFAKIELEIRDLHI